MIRDHLCIIFITIKNINKLKKVTNILVTAALILSSFSCQSDDNATIVSNNKKELQIAACTISGPTDTRALIANFIKDVQVGIFINGNYTPKVVKYTYDGSSVWNSEANNKIYLLNDEASVYGFYPADSNIGLYNDGTSKISINIPAIESSLDASSQTDYMYATAVSTDVGATYPVAKANNVSCQVSIAFHHALSKIRFIINAASGYTGLGKITSLVLSNTNNFNVGDGNINVADGNITLEDLSPTLTYTGSLQINASATPASTVPTIEKLVPPTASGNTTISMTIDGKEMKVDLPTDSKWEAGKNYTYTVTVNNNGLSVDSVNITDWIDQAITNPINIII